MRWKALAIVAASLALLNAGTAFAQGRRPAPDPVLAEAKRLFDDGATAYGTGNYEDAIKLWEKSYQISQKPLILDNIANAWEKLANLRKTREYLAKWRDAAPPEEQSMLEMRLRTLDARIAREDEAAAAKAAADKAARDAAAQKAAVYVDPRPWLPGAILAGAGGVAVIAGVVVDGVAKSKRPPSSSCVTSSGLVLCQSSAESAITLSNRMAIAGDVTWIVGAVAVAGGVTWALLPRFTGLRTGTGSRSTNSASGPVVTRITVTPGGASIAGTF